MERSKRFILTTVLFHLSPLKIMGIKLKKSTYASLKIAFPTHHWTLSLHTAFRGKLKHVHQWQCSIASKNLI